MRYVLNRAKGGRRIHICEPEKRRTNFYWISVAKGDGPSESVMFVSEKVAALRADLETMKREKEEVTALRAELERAKKNLARIRREGETMKQRKEFERLRRERSWGTCFDRQVGDNSADRRGTAVPTMGTVWPRGVSTAADSEQSLTYVYRGIVPKLPVECSLSKYIAWEQRFEFFIANQGLRHTISLDAPEIAVISSTNNAYLFGQFGEELVLEHRQVWGYISDAAVYAPFESSLYKCHSISDALRMMRKWHLPLYPAERHLLVAELERVQLMGDEKSEIVQFILRQFPERPSHPHALVVGRGCRDGGAAGVGVQRRDNNMASCGGGMPRQQQQPQQYWSRGGAMPQQQQQQQLQYWSRDGGIPHQHQRRSHAFPPARQARQPQPLQLPSRRIHTSGGDGEHGRNPLSPPATEAVPDTSVFPAASSKAVAEAPMSSAGAASTSVPAAAPAIGGTVFPTTSVGGAARAPASDDGTVALTATSATGGTVPSAASIGGAPASSAVAAASVESAAEPAISGTVRSATSVRGEVGRRESSAGAVPSNAAAEAAPSTGDTAAPVESAAWAARKLASATGSAGDRWLANICGEREASTHPFDPGTVFPPEVRYSTHGNISSSNSRGNSSSCSSNDTTSNHDSWWEATYVGALLRPFDPGKGCQRDARIGAVLGLDLPFDRGKT